VGDDLERADRALDAEIVGQNRRSLIDKLETMLDDADVDDDGNVTAVDDEDEPEPEPDA
jgi:hypothetical protein